MNPLADLAVGTGSGTLSGTLSEYGIRDDFIRSLADTLKPDTSAFFVLVREAQPEKVMKELSRFGGHVLRSSLSPEPASAKSDLMLASRSGLAFGQSRFGNA